MQKNKIKISVIIMFLLILTFTFTGCSNSLSSYNESISKEMNMGVTVESSDMVMPSKSEPNFSINKESPEMGINTESRDDTSIDTKNTTDLDYGNRKMIKTGNISIETLNYDKSYDSIISIIKKYDGYLEQINENNDKHYNKSLKRANMTIRVPKNNYDKLLNEASDNGYVSNKSSSVRDVSDIYFDTEARLKSLKLQEDRLLVILEKTEQLNNIIQLENTLANTRYQIETLTGTLMKYDKLISYSTLNLNLIEVEEETKDVPTKQESFSNRIKYSLEDNLKNTKNSIENFILLIAMNIIQILITIIFMGLLIFAINRSNHKLKKVVQKKNEDKNEKNK